MWGVSSVERVALCLAYSILRNVRSRSRRNILLDSLSIGKASTGLKFLKFLPSTKKCGNSMNKERRKEEKDNDT
jgi:hypothetical protein